MIDITQNFETPVFKKLIGICRHSFSVNEMWLVADAGHPVKGVGCAEQRMGSCGDWGPQ